MEILGIDVGAVVIKAAIVDVDSGKLVSDRYRTPSPEQNNPAKLMTKIHEIVKFYNWDGQIGIALPTVVVNGVIVDPLHISPSWQDADAEHLFEELTDCSVSILNDADAAGIAEMTFGSAKDYNGLVIILTIGTGIGSSIFNDGVLIPNAELGRVEINGIPADRSASRTVRKEEGLKKRTWARRIQSVLKTYENMFYPELFVLGGWISKKAHKILPYIDINTPIIPAQLLNEAGIVGAACYAARKGRRKIDVIGAEEIKANESGD